jgi:2,4-dienoyl-CoA reductase (NADPH2)
MEADDIAAVVAGFAAATKVAIDAGCDGVEINAGQHSLVRQFLSGLTNQRDDEWGADRTLFARQVLTVVRGASGDGVVGLRFSGDELAPWAGMTPEQAPAMAAGLAEWVDYLVVVRGAIFRWKDRPDFHEPTNFNVELCRSVRSAVRSRVAVVLGDRSSTPPRQPAVRDGRGRRRGGDDTRADRRSGPGTQDRGRRLGAPVHPLQPDVPGARRPQPHRDVRGRADERARDGGP